MSDVRFITQVFPLAALAILFPFSVLAQHVGSGHAGSPSVRAGVGSHFSSPHVGAPPLGLLPPASSYTGIRFGALRSYSPYRIGHNYLRNYRHVPYAYFYAPFYYPSLDYASSPYPDYGYDYDPASDPNAQGDLMAQNAIGDQLNRLSAEVDQMRYGQLPGPPMAPPPATSQDTPPSTPPVTLVLRNGQQLRVQNYAVMDQTFWDFSAQPAQKIPIANIDVAASAKATIADGGEFPQLPTSPGGQ